MITFFIFIDVDFLLFYEPNGDPHLDVINKFKLGLNQIIAEPKLEPEQCDVAHKQRSILHQHF